MKIREIEKSFVRMKDEAQDILDQMDNFIWDFERLNVELADKIAEMNDELENIAELIEEAEK